MILFLDTEFTTPGKEMQLLSLALVSGEGREFYCERNDVPPSHCSDFVFASVLPHFGQFPDDIGDWARCKARLKMFLDSLPHASQVACDAPQDTDLLMWLYGGWPDKLFKPRIHLEQITHPAFEEALHGYHAIPGRPWHHALWDARALRQAWLALSE